MLDITMIGCGATMPLPGRAVAACAVKHNGRVALLDCGEGTQAAARAAGVSLVRVEAVLLTHYHGDHIFGLPGLLQTMASLGRTAPVRLLGPAADDAGGLAHWAGLLLALAGPLPFAVQCVPLPAAQKTIPLWDGLSVTAFPMAHRVPCVGYRFDLPRAGRFLAPQAQALGVPRPLWGVLQKGEAVTLADGRTVTPGQVLGLPRRGLRVVYACDTAPCAAVTAQAADADLLICDGTYADDAEADKAALYGHCTFRQAAQMAADAGVRRLLLTHFGGALTDPAAALPAAQSIYPAAAAAHDGLTLRLVFDGE